MALKSFKAALAEKKSDNTLWSARDALEEAIRCIDSGELKADRLMIVFSTIKEGDGGEETTESYYVNMDLKTRVALMAALFQKETEMFRGVG